MKFAIFFIAIMAISSNVSARDFVTRKFAEWKLIPDLVPTAPARHMSHVEVRYPSGLKVVIGKELTPTQVKEQPNVFFPAHSHLFYTLLFVDAASETDEVKTQWQHWTVVNIPGGDVSRGQVLSQYISSGPLEGTGWHRYTYMIYEQPGWLNFDEPLLNNTSIAGRAGFSAEKFVEKYSLVGPVAGTFYRCKYDDYVPILYARFGITDLSALV